MWPQAPFRPMHREVKQTTPRCTLWRKGSFPAPNLPAHNKRLERSQLGRAWTVGKGGGAEALNLRKHSLWRQQESSGLHLSVPGMPLSSSYS